MQTLTADARLHEVLMRTKEEAELLDANGKVVGHFKPMLDPDEKEVYERAAELFDLEEMQRLAQYREPGYTFDQVMEHLRKLGKADNERHYY